MPNFHAGRLERRVRRVGNGRIVGKPQTSFCLFLPFGARRNGADAIAPLTENIRYFLQFQIKNPGKSQLHLTKLPYQYQDLS